MTPETKTPRDEALLKIKNRCYDSKALTTDDKIEFRELIEAALSEPEAVEERADLLELHEQTKLLAKGNDAKRRVVCAACVFPDGLMLTGIRHFSPDMRLVANKLGYTTKDYAAAKQGFVDQWGNFLTRQEAYIIAYRQGQYNPYEPYTPGTLYSEDLY